VLPLLVTLGNLRSLVYPAEKITPEPAVALKEHEAESIGVIREDGEMRRTGIIRSHPQVFELARKHLGNNGGTM
jgi:hypothetical protein